MHINIYNRVITLQSFEISHLLAVVNFLLNAVVDADAGLFKSKYLPYLTL